MLDFFDFFMMPMHFFQSQLQYDVSHDSKFHYLKNHLFYLPIVIVGGSKTMQMDKSYSEEFLRQAHSYPIHCA